VHRVIVHTKDTGVGSGGSTSASRQTYVTGGAVKAACEKVRDRAFDVIHDQARPGDVLREVARALRPDGTFLMVDVRASSDLAGNIGHPLGPFLYGMSTMHCMTVSLALDGAGLGTVWGEEKALAMLREAGFTSVEVHRLGPDDPLNNYYVARKGGDGPAV